VLHNLWGRACRRHRAPPGPVLVRRLPQGKPLGREPTGYAMPMLPPHPTQKPAPEPAHAPKPYHPLSPQGFPCSRPPQAIFARRPAQQSPMHAMRESGCCRKSGPSPPNSRPPPMTTQRQFDASNHCRHHSASLTSIAPVIALAADVLSMAVPGNSSGASLLQYTAVTLK
jgi:hypothetical protein